MIKKTAAIILINIFLVTGCQFPDASCFAAEPLHLEQLITEARQNNPDILAAKKRWDAAQARIPQAKSLDSPSVGISVEKIPRGTLKLDRTMPEDRMLSVSQMFPLFGKLPLKGKIALVEWQMAGAEYKAKELEIINKVKIAYYDLFMNYKEIELLENSLALLESVARAAEARYSIKDMEQEELLKIHLEIAHLSNDIANLKEEQSAKITNINTLLNKDPQGRMAVPQIEEDAGFDKDIKELYALALVNQPELIVFSYAIERNKFAKSLAKRSFFPDMMAGIAQRGIASGALGPWDLMLSFTVPFWFWTKQKYEVKEAIANLEEAEAAYKAMQNKAFAEVKAMHSKIRIAKNKIHHYKSSLLPILESSIQASLAGFASGKGDFMMLLDSQRILIQTKLDYYKALVEYNMNLADLERTVGISLR